MGAIGLEPSDDAVFKALADATRRDLLDALYAVDGQSLGQLAARHPHLTRFGVMKHLAVLEDAGLAIADDRKVAGHTIDDPISGLSNRTDPPRR